MAGLPQILIVEPHPDVARALRTILDCTLHVQTLHAADHVDLADLLSRNRPDLIVVDAVSRELDAPTIVANLRAAPGTRHVPIVGISISGAAADAALPPPPLPLPPPDEGAATPEIRLSPATAGNRDEAATGPLVRPPEAPPPMPPTPPNPALTPYAPDDPEEDRRV